MSNQTIPELTTQRLLLRAPRQDDFSVYEAFYADSAQSRFYGGPLKSREAWTKLAMEVGHWSLKGYGVWSIEIQSTGEMVGGCGFWWPDGWPRPELTWWLIEAARGEGLATEASLAALDFAYRELNWDIVETHLDDDNETARRLVLRLGGAMLTRDLFPDGIERNVYSIPPPSAST